MIRRNGSCPRCRTVDGADGTGHSQTARRSPRAVRTAAARTCPSGRASAYRASSLCATISFRSSSAYGALAVGGGSPAGRGSGQARNGVTEVSNSRQPSQRVTPGRSHPAHRPPSTRSTNASRTGTAHTIRDIPAARNRAPPVLWTTISPGRSGRWVPLSSSMFTQVRSRVCQCRWPWTSLITGRVSLFRFEASSRGRNPDGAPGSSWSREPSVLTSQGALATEGALVTVDVPATRRPCLFQAASVTVERQLELAELTEHQLAVGDGLDRPGLHVVVAGGLGPHHQQRADTVRRHPQHQRCVAGKLVVTSVGLAVRGRGPAAAVWRPPGPGSRDCHGCRSSAAAPCPGSGWS